jgi:hypothetical protein
MDPEKFYADIDEYVENVQKKWLISIPPNWKWLSIYVIRDIYRCR